MAGSKLMRIEVIYPLPREQRLMAVQMPEGATLREGILTSGVLTRYPELSLDTLEAGIFGKLAALDEPLREHDRIEIYRPLIADPKTVRKQRAAEGKRMKRGGGDVESDAG